MFRSTRIFVSVLTISIGLPFALTACSASAPQGDIFAPVPDPDTAAGISSCIVGDWALDATDYEDKAQAYFDGKGLVVDYVTVIGTSTMRFTSNGKMSSHFDETVTVALHATSEIVPLSFRDAYTSAADWKAGDAANTIEFSHWQTTPDPSVTTDPDAITLPPIDYSATPTLSLTCDAHSLTLTVPDAPFAPKWIRQ